MYPNSDQLRHTSTGHSTQKPVEGILSTGVSVSAPKQEPKESPVRSDHDIAQADHWPETNPTGLLERNILVNPRTALRKFEIPALLDPLSSSRSDTIFNTGTYNLSNGNTLFVTPQLDASLKMQVRFPLSLRNVEDLLHERRIEVGHEWYPASGRSVFRKEELERNPVATQ